MSAEINSENNELYSNKLIIFVREFKSQSSGREADKFALNSTSLTNFCALLWEKVKPLIKAEVVITGENFEWASTEPTVDDLVK